MTNKNKINYQICKKLVLDTSYPGIMFDKDGVSSQYWDYQNNIKDKWKSNRYSILELEKIVEQIKKKEQAKNLIVFWDLVAAQIAPICFILL